MAEFIFANAEMVEREEELPLFKEFAWDFENDCFNLKVVLSCLKKGLDYNKFILKPKLSKIFTIVIIIFKKY